MSLSRLKTAFGLRVQLLSQELTHADLTDADSQQDFDFDVDLPEYAMVVGGWVDVDEKFASPAGVATAATKTGGAEPYALTAGWTVVLDTDNNGNETITFDAAAGTQECTTYFPVSDLNGKKLNVSVDGGANQLVTFASPCTTDAHVRAQIAAATTGLAVSAASTAKAAFIPTNTVAAPFVMRTNGVTVIIDVDNDGADTATWVAARAVSAGSGLSISDLTALTLLLKIDGEATAQTITFAGTESTAALAAATINAQLRGGSAVVNAGEIDIYSDTYGTSSVVEITGGTGAAQLGQAVAVNTEATSDAVNCSAVTIAEIKTWLEAAITGASGITVTDLGTGYFSIISNTTGALSELDVQASTALTALGLSVVTVVGTASQPKLTSDTKGTDSSIAVTDVDSGLTWASAVAGTGDVADISAVTAAEVIALVEADTIASCQTASGGKFTIVSPTTGASSELDFKSGTALTALGLAVEVKTGSAATAAGTATFDIGTSADRDSLIDGANASAATGIVNGPKGTGMGGYYSEDTVTIRVDSSGPNLNLFNEGEATVWIAYVDLTKDLV